MRLVQKRQNFQVGTISARPGTIASGMLQIPAGVDAGTELPVSIIHGAKDGPVLALIAGNHGYEYPPILALQKLLPKMDAKKIAGTVVMVHVANVPSFLGRTIYFSPVDQKNLNRVYPGRTDGTVSERIAYAVTTEVIEKSDYVLDLHCGDGNESLRPYGYQAVTGDEKMDEAIGKLALAFGLEHIVLDHGRPKDPMASLFCSTTAITRGKPAIIAEIGYLGTTDAGCVAEMVKGVNNVMKFLKMAPGTAARPAKPVYYDPAAVLTSPVTGILYPAVERDRRVKKGALIAHITDFFGKKMVEIRAPFDGRVLYVVATPPIVQGQPVGCVGAPVKRLPD